MSFDNIIGQKRALNHLKTLLKNGRIPTGFLFCGAKGVGKRLAALGFACVLNCEDEKSTARGDSCDKCSSCRSIAKNIHPDVIVADFNFQAELLELAVQKQQHIRIETIRELINKAQQKPALGRWKVFIINYAETMLRGAGNALLKLLEEPPPKTLWILVSSRKHAMLSTILSRCQVVDFAPLAASEVEKILVQKGFSAGRAQVLAKFSRGSIERALEIKEVFEKFSGLDTSDINFPFQICELLGRELVSARGQCRIMLELLMTVCFDKWKNEKKEENKLKLCKFMEKLHKFENYLARNVSPHRIIQVSLVGAEKLSVNPFSNAVNLVQL